MFFYTKNTHKLCKFSTADKICEAALTLFAEQGFFNTSIHHIQEKSQVSIGSIYHHFGNKKTIANQLQTQILTQMDLAFAEVIAQNESCQDTSFQDKYLQLINLLFTMTEEEPRTMKFIFHSKYSEYSNLHKSIFQSAPFKSIYNEVVNDCNSPIIAEQLDSIDLIMATLFSLPIQLIQLRLDKVLTKPITQRTEIVFKTVWGGLCKEY